MPPLSEALKHLPKGAIVQSKNNAMFGMVSGISTIAKDDDLKGFRKDHKYVVIEVEWQDDTVSYYNPFNLIPISH